MAGQIKVDRSGARSIELFMPFDFMGVHIDMVTLGPCVLDHTLRWKEAKFKDWFELMVDIAQVGGRPATTEQLRQLRYPDADRVVQNFFEILPADIKDAVLNGKWPERVEPPPPSFDGHQMNGGDRPMTQEEQQEFVLPSQMRPQPDGLNVDD
jgi:hypothetical protein